MSPSRTFGSSVVYARSGATSVVRKQWYAMKMLSDKVANIVIEGEIGVDEDIETGEVSGVSAKVFERDLKALGQLDEIVVDMNTPGGNVFDGSQINLLLKRSKAKVTVRIGALCASIGTVIAMAADEIQIAPSSLFMIHNPWSIEVGDAHALRKAADMLDKLKDSMMNAYLAKVDIDETELVALLDAETWMTGVEAVEAGFADTLLTEDVKAKAVMSRNFVKAMGIRRAPKNVELTDEEKAAKAEEDAEKARASKAAEEGAEPTLNDVIAAIGALTKTVGDLVTALEDDGQAAPENQTEEEKARAAAEEEEKAKAKAAAEEEAEKARAEAGDDVDVKSKAYIGLANLAASLGRTADLTNALMAGASMAQLRSVVIDAQSARTEDIQASVRSRTVSPGSDTPKNRLDPDAIYAKRNAKKRA